MPSVGVEEATRPRGTIPVIAYLWKRQFEVGWDEKGFFSLESGVKDDGQHRGRLQGLDVYSMRAWSLDPAVNGDILGSGDKTF